MPKRRMTAKRKAAVAKWQKAGAEARKRAAVRKAQLPTGKNTLLVHYTYPSNAKAIIKSRKWTDTFGGSDVSSFSRWNHRKGFSQYGPVMLTVRVPRKTVQRRKSLGLGESGDMLYERYVKHSDLAGRKVTRVAKNPRRRKAR